jgi:uncharacterized protein
VARIGLISDTHGLLRPEALEFLRGSDHIVHAGDIGDPAILEALATLAPVTAVRGNNDMAPWAAGIEEQAVLEMAGLRIHVLHDIAQLEVDPAAAGIHAVVTGHSHKPAARTHGGVLYVNPGSAGPRRFRLPVSIGELRVANGALQPRLVEFACR